MEPSDPERLADVVPLFADPAQRFEVPESMSPRHLRRIVDGWLSLERCRDPAHRSLLPYLLSGLGADEAMRA